MSASLPARPHADHLRRQARDLLRALQAQDAAAWARAEPYRLARPPKLAGAQLVIAREYGFASWPRLMDEVERRQAAALSDAGFEHAVLTWALGRGWQTPKPERALALLGSRQVQTPALALVQGDLPAVQRLLAGADLKAPVPPLATAALGYAAFSALARLDSHREGLVATVRWLLAQGADPNTRWADPVRPEERLPVLYGAVSRAGCFETVQALLDAGADANDNESLYHATEQADRRIIAALVAAGARWPGTNALFRQLDHDQLDHLRQALDLGADVLERAPGGGGPLHHAIVRGRSAAFVQLLVERGADPGLRDPHGQTPALLAARLGDAETVDYLASIGHGAALDERGRFLAACAAGDETTARAYVAAHPRAVASLPRLALRLLPDQAQRGRLGAVRLMLALGWPLDVPGDWQASALNQAAFRGDAAMVRLLLEHGAQWSEPNGYGGDALGSCLHAGTNQPDPAGDYAEVLRLLLARGAPPPQDTDALPDEMRAVLGA